MTGLIRTTAFLAVLAGAAPSNAQFIDPPHRAEPPSAVLSHPRLFITAQQLPKYRTWAATNNKMWNTMVFLADRGKAYMDQGKVPANDSGLGRANYEPFATEQYAELFAFMSLMDHSPAKQADYAKRAHDLLMHVVNLADGGVASPNTPFRDPAFAIHNRSRWFGEAFPLVVDWCYPTFTAPEKAKIRRVFLRWIQENLRAETTGPYDHPKPEGVVNSTLLTADKYAVRYTSNNYYCNHARQVGMLALALDPADDVPSGPGEPPARSLRQFVGNAIGAWMKTIDYCEKTYTKGGISPEGLGYGESDTSAIAMLLLALNTSGMDAPATYGAPAAMAEGDFWKHELPDAFVHSMSPRLVTQKSWIGPSHMPADFGDMGEYAPVNYIRTFAPMALIARAKGDAATYDKYRWMIDEYEPGHRSSRQYQMEGVLESYGALFSIFYFLVVDPKEPSKLDQRPGMPTDYVAPGLNRVLSRTDWTPDAAWIGTKCGWISSDHNGKDANKIEFYRNGEWMTKGRTGYGFNVGASDFQNTMCVQNYTPPGLTDFWSLEASRGAQFSYNHAEAGAALASFGPDHTYTQGNATGQYNLSANTIEATDVLHASRSIMWLKPDFVILYDRALSRTAGKFKRVYLNTAKLATVTGKSATAATPKGQRLHITSVLPAGAVVKSESLPPSANGPDGNQTAQLEPMRCRVMIENPNPPKAIQFLTILQGADANTPMASYSRVASTSGDAYDGVIVNDAMVLFKTNMLTAFTGASFNVPGIVNAIYITGLKPGAAYTVKKNPVGGSFKLIVTVGGTTMADKGGVVRV
ncbi:hypothetical protein EON81_19220 [bacterium]|nr:MAG: hypothetical protein EON81_19220 [bacterium]